MSKVNMKRILAIALIVSNVGVAASTREIDEVRKKTVFTSEDLAIVDSFINNVFREMLEAPTVNDSVKRREDILVRLPKEGQDGYKQQFIESVQRNIASSLQAVGTWTDEKFIKGMRLNLAVMVGLVDAPQLMDLALKMTETDEIAVRYWAIKAFTGREVAAFIKANPTSELVQAVIEEFNNVAALNSPIILEMAAKFAADIDAPQTNEILSKIAQTRIDAYRRRVAVHESSDGQILSVIASRMRASEQNKQALANNFAGLLASVLQKYQSGMSPDSGLGEISSQQLITAIANIEKNVLPGLNVSSELIRAVERKNIGDFQQAYTSLFGQDGNQGEVAAKLGVEIDI
jgi:hypothetical protein